MSTLTLDSAALCRFSWELYEGPEGTTEGLVGSGPSGWADFCGESAFLSDQDNRPEGVLELGVG